MTLGRLAPARWLLAPAAVLLLSGCPGSAGTRTAAPPLGPHPDAARLAASQPAQAAPGGEGPVQAPPGPPPDPRR